jgi:L-ribulose-5-phosphate 3-epimerase
MQTSLLPDRLAVCSWSLQPKNPGELLRALQEIGIPRLQLALDPVRAERDVWGNIAAQCASAGVTIASGMFGTVGEDYSTMESIRRTGGIVPDATWDENRANIQQVADIASTMNLKLVTFHAGFLPHDPGDPGYGKLLERLRAVADIFAAKQIDLGLETGQETATALDEFLVRLDRKNVGVNFDPANMILYDKGDPIEALRKLGPWLKQCHIKDARKTAQAGTWGEEVTAGTGEVDWRAFFRTLTDVNFRGDLAIEREAGDQRIPDIKAARDFVLSLFP